MYPSACVIAMGLATMAVPSIFAEEPSFHGLNRADWASIRAAYEAGRLAIHCRHDGVRVARNPGQNWRTEFDGAGFLVRPATNEWSWGMKLESCGGHEFPATALRTVTGGNRLVYRWGEHVEEWFVNGPRGLQQGWIVRKPPELGHRATLSLTFHLRGDLAPRISADRRSVDFQTAHGAAALTYTGLKAWDAENHALDVRFAPGGNESSLAILVDATRATYPITIDPIAQRAYLKASGTGANDQFGQAVAISGNTIVVGAPFEDSAATGVNGDESGDSATDSGAAYVFVRDGSGAWSQQAYLKASNTGAGDKFGISVAVSGDLAVIGAPFEDSAATGVNGNQNSGASSSGAAYVFVRNGTVWTQQAYLKASNTGADDFFGYAVAVSGNTVAVGAYGEDSAALGVDGNQSGNAASGSGAAYLFVWNGASWSQQAYLKASNTEAGDQFGRTLAISGDTLVIGAHQEDSAASGVDGNQSDNTAANSGAAYVFARGGSAWSQQAYLKAANTGADDQFGYAVAVAGDTIVVGAPEEDSAATGVNGNPSDNSVLGSGAAYVFERSGTAWNQQAYLKASNTGPGDRFGRAAAISGDLVVIGAPNEDSATTGVDGNGGNNSAESSGAAYLFAHDGTAWSQQAYLKASNSDAGDFFGSSVAVDGSIVPIGAFGEDSAATGVNGNSTDDNATGSGAVFAFQLDAPPIPEISVEQPLETSLASGVSAVDFGTAALGGPVSLEFALRNPGSGDLTGIAASLDNTADFSLGSAPADSVHPGGVTVFWVTFHPSAIGLRTGTLTIASSDADENPFSIALAGEGVTARQVFDAILATTGLAGSDAEPDAAPFHDGVTNLLKYAFNMDLAGADSHTMEPGGISGLPFGRLLEDGGAIFWEIQYLRRKASGLVYAPRKSATLESFVPMYGDSVVENIDAAWERVTVREPYDPAATPNCFGRVEVTMP